MGNPIRDPLFNIGDTVVLKRGFAVPFGWNSHMEDQIGRLAEITYIKWDETRDEYEYNVSGDAGGWAWAEENFETVRQDLPEFQAECIDSVLALFS